MLTCDLIYRTYLHGPGAVCKLIEQHLGEAALRPPPDPSLQQTTIESQMQDITRLQAQVARLQDEVRQLHYLNSQLQRRVSELEARLAKNSTNSDKPPSTDSPAVKRTKSLRRPSGKRVGGQPGHHGATLSQVAEPDEVVLHSPAQCRGCGASLTGGKVMGCELRQVFDLPTVKLHHST